MPKSLMDIQIKETGELTWACWATYLERTNDWEAPASIEDDCRTHMLLTPLIIHFNK
jgi:hypothetical protein